MYPINRNWSALIVALVIMTLLTMMSTVFFEKIYRFSQRSEWIENSNIAYYKSLGIIEEALFTGWVDKYTPWNIANNSRGSTNNSGSKITVNTGGVLMPLSGKWNSPYNKDYNIISLGQPVQIVIPQGINWSNVNFEFRVPIILGNTSTGVAWASSSGYVLWTLASSGVSLFASGETNIFKWSELNQPNMKIALFMGTTNSGSSQSFQSFYNNPPYLGDGTSWGKCTWFKCTLKLSLIRSVPTTDGRSMSFLEYQIKDFWTTIPSQYIDIHAEGYAYWFLRSRDLQFPQITTNTALDFAVLQ